MVAAMDGNLSVRLANGNILSTPTLMSKGLIEADDLVIVDSDGRKNIFRNQIDYLVDDNGEIIVDFVGRFERLQEAMVTLDEIAGVAGVSRFHLVRAFAAACGLPGRAVAEVRGKPSWPPSGHPRAIVLRQCSPIPQILSSCLTL